MADAPKPPADSGTPPSPTSSGPTPPSPATTFDPSVPHPARVYGYWLGGKDHFQADREAAQEVIRHRPQVVAGARANRAFLGRVVRYLAADCGIGQFIDIGTGLPAPGSTHEVAQAADPECRVVYVDNDPLVMTHAHALLKSHPQGVCDYVHADLRDTATILDAAEWTLNLDRPTAVLLLAVLHLVPGTDNPAGVVAALAAGLAPGSYVAVSHMTADFAPAEVTAAAQAYNALAPVPVTARSHSEVSALFGGLPLVAPGVVQITEWRPGLSSRFPRTADFYAGLGRIPGRRS
jgi:S-adenosyl methyltransferase